jgi:hypothetical protein
MTTWTPTTKNVIATEKFYLLIEDTFHLLIGDGYKLQINNLTGEWTDTTKNTSTFTNINKS